MMSISPGSGDDSQQNHCDLNNMEPPEQERWIISLSLYETDRARHLKGWSLS